MQLSEKQIQILKVAEKLFAENGFDGTSVRLIAKDAGINVAMISYYFGSKEKLLAALLYYRSSDFKMELETVISTEKGYLEKVDEIVELSIKRIHRNRRIYKIIHFEYSNAARNIGFGNYLNQKKENYVVIENFVKGGQAAGVFAKNITVPLIVPTIMGSYFNIYYNKRFFRELHGLKKESSFDDYVHNQLIKHIQKTIKALLTYED